MGFGACPLRGNLNRLKGRAEDNLEKKEMSKKKPILRVETLKKKKENIKRNFKERRILRKEEF